MQLKSNNLQVLSKKYIVTLVVECDHLAALELRLVVKHRGQHASNRMAQAGGHIIDDHFWTTVIELCTILKIFYKKRVNI